MQVQYEMLWQLGATGLSGSTRNVGPGAHVLDGRRVARNLSRMRSLCESMAQGDLRKKVLAGGGARDKDEVGSGGGGRNYAQGNGSRRSSRGPSAAAGRDRLRPPQPAQAGEGFLFRFGFAGNHYVHEGTSCWTPGSPLSAILDWRVQLWRISFGRFYFHLQQSTSASHEEWWRSQTSHDSGSESDLFLFRALFPMLMFSTCRRSRP